MTTKTDEQDRRDFEAWWESTPILKENKRTIAEKAYQAGRATLQSQPTDHWYAIDNTGLATLCADKQDAINTASEAAQLYPTRVPYVVARMVPADADLQSQDREDAERYRWLLKDCYRWPANGGHCNEFDQSEPVALWVKRKVGDDPCAAIDHARRVEDQP